MSKPKKIGVSIFMVVLTTLLILSSLLTLITILLFSSGSGSAKLFSNYLYLMSSKEMEPEISYGSAVFADADDIQVLTEGNVVLCKIKKDREAVLRITEVVHNTDNTIYKVAGDSTPDTVFEVDKSNVLAKCTSSDKTLGSAINLIISTKGVVIFLILPCILLVIFIFATVISSRKRNAEEDEYYEEDPVDYQYGGYDDGDNDEYYDDEDYEEPPQRRAPRPNNPLFEPGMPVRRDPEFQRKKSSIAENFAQKYPAGSSGKTTTFSRTETPDDMLINDLANQKRSRRPAERQRSASSATMAVERFKMAVDENPSTPFSKTPANAENDKMAAIKAALRQKEEQENAARNKSRESAPRSEGTRTAKRPKPQKPAVKKRNDNINSIEDLIKALEDEKKKL